jgi:hypothetical protein
MTQHVGDGGLQEIKAGAEGIVVQYSQYDCWVRRAHGRNFVVDLATTPSPSN